MQRPRVAYFPNCADVTRLAGYAGLCLAVLPLDPPAFFSASCRSPYMTMRLGPSMFVMKAVFISAPLAYLTLYSGSI